MPGSSQLLWAHGDVRGVNDRSYFQGSRSTPRPIGLVRHAGHGPWDDTRGEADARLGKRAVSVPVLHVTQWTAALSFPDDSRSKNGQSSGTR